MAHGSRHTRRGHGPPPNRRASPVHGTRGSALATAAQSLCGRRVRALSSSKSIRSFASVEFAPRAPGILPSRPMV